MNALMCLQMGTLRVSFTTTYTNSKLSSV